MMTPRSGACWSISCFSSAFNLWSNSLAGSNSVSWMISPAGVFSLYVSGTSNEGKIFRPLSSNRNSAKSPVLARSSGMMPMSWIGRVITSPLTRKWRMPGHSIVGAMASTSLPATSSIRPMTSFQS